MRHIFRAGDKVRVLVDEPYETELRAGEVVTILVVMTKTDSDGSSYPVLAVATNAGQRFLKLDVVEPFTDAYSPAKPDDDVDTQLRGMLAADAELGKIVEVAETILTDMAEADAALFEHDHDDDEDDEECADDYLTSRPENRFAITDTEGDTLDVFYAEQQCDEHGREGAFLFEINGDHSVLIPIDYAGNLLRFLLDRARFSQRPDDGTVAE